MNPSQIGDVAEAKVLSKFKSLGHTVSLPFGDNARFDMIVGDEDLVRVQAKSGSYNENKQGIVFNTSSISQRTDNVATTYTDKEIDGFAVYCQYTDKCYWVPVNDAPQYKMKLRVGDTKIDSPQTTYANDYTLTENFN